MGLLGDVVRTVTGPASGVVRAINPLGGLGTHGAIEAGRSVAGGGQQVSTMPVYTPPSPAETRREREADITRGQERGRELFRDQLGRLIERTPGRMQNILTTRQQQAEMGFGAPAFQAAREARLAGLGRQEQQAQRQLARRQAQMGLRGGAAAGQLAQLMGQQQAQRQGAEREMFLADVAQRQGLSQQYEQSLRDALAGEEARRRFNIGQVGRERFGELASGLGEAQIGAAERGGLQQADIGRAMQQAMMAGGGGKK